jgi:hypothetical protein
VTPEQEHHLLAVFDGAAQRRLAYLGDEFSAFFTATRLLPHFEVVEKARAKAVIDNLKRARISRRTRDRSLDAWILSCWTHHGVWAFSNNNRPLVLGVWLERIALEFPECRSFGALSSADAFRQRIVRLGLIGWGAFPSTYSEPPLEFDSVHRLIEPAIEWQHLFGAGGVNNSARS